MTSNPTVFAYGTGPYTDGMALVTTPADHTMGARLGDYVLPKVPVSAVLHTVGRAHVYANQSLGLLVGGEKRQGKSFNWRRPFFTDKHGLVHCVVTPGQDYAHHYARLIATACALVGIEPHVEIEMPNNNQTIEFVDRWLPLKLKPSDVIVLGYVERIFADATSRWELRPGFGWRSALVGGSLVTLLGCEFSYWGDLAGALVTVLAERKCASWVIYVGKLGTLTPGTAPNQYVATGTMSMVGGREVMWDSHLDLGGTNDGDVLAAQRHITVPSTLDETRTWYRQHVTHFDVVDPEIGRMAEAAIQAGIQFDYLHVVSDNLSGKYVHGLYDERTFDIATNRRRCLTIIESILRRSFV